jgi:hypothetical protein
MNDSETSRFKELTFLWEKHCLIETEIIVTICDNVYILDSENFGTIVIILDECSQATEPAALLPVEQFIKTLRLIILGGDDQ